MQHSNLKSCNRQDTWLQFLCSGDGAELLEHNLPQPHHYERLTLELYRVAWLIDGYFHTKSGIEFFNDMIARLTLTLPIVEREEAAVVNVDGVAMKLKVFQNAISLRTQYVKQAIKHNNELSNDMVWWAIKFQTESFIRQFDGWFDYGILEQWAFNVFEVGQDVKDRSTLKAKCRSTWHWYERRNFTIPKQNRGFKMSRKDHMKKVNEQRKIDAKQKVLDAAGTLFVKNKSGKIVVSRVAEVAGVHKDTARKYLKELGLLS